MTQPSPALRVFMVAALVIVYAVALVLLIVSGRRLSDLAPRVAAAEAAALQAKTSQGVEVQNLRSNLTAAEQRQVALLARFPGDLQAGVFDEVAGDAQKSGIANFAYQRKNDYPDTMQAGTYRVYRFTIQGRGSREQVLSFLDGLLKDTGPAILMENVILQPVAGGLQFSADILVYSLVSQ